MNIIKQFTTNLFGKKSTNKSFAQFTVPISASFTVNILESIQEHGMYKVSAVITGSIIIVIYTYNFITYLFDNRLLDKQFLENDKQRKYEIEKKEKQINHEIEQNEKDRKIEEMKINIEQQKIDFEKCKLSVSNL